jgi:hypothetical protein
VALEHLDPVGLITLASQQRNGSIIVMSAFRNEGSVRTAYAAHYP